MSLKPQMSRLKSLDDKIVSTYFLVAIRELVFTAQTVNCYILILQSGNVFERRLLLLFCLRK